MKYSIGDVHGCLDLLLDIHKQIMEHAATVDEDHTIIFLGDYIDRGPDSKKVLDFLMSEPFDGFEHIFLLGNHEQMFIDAMEGHNTNLFLGNGGDKTLQSFYTLNLDDEILEPYKNWMKKLKLFHVDDGFLFVHAGMDPRRTFEDNAKNSLIWIRDEFLIHDSDFLVDDKPVFVIHGHTPVTYDKPILDPMVFLTDEMLDEIEERQMNPIPIIKHNRMNLDTGSAYTGIISAAVIGDEKVLGYFLSNNTEMVVVE